MKSDLFAFIRTWLATATDSYRPNMDLYPGVGFVKEIEAMPEWVE